MKVITGGATAAHGFKANGVSCGIKRSGKLDLGLIACDHLANTAAVFTKNSIKAAPVVVSHNHIKKGKCRAIIVNSGNANCFTGDFGLAYAQKSTKAVAKLLDAKESDVLVASTGIIGVPLPFKKIKKALPGLIGGLKTSSHKKLAQAILTTDTVTKETAVRFSLNGKHVTIGGCAKGAGMIEPNMATMLSFITTDAAISSKMLKQALKEAVNRSFNMITIDGCMSTNDMVAVLASGQAKNKTITKKGKDYQKFCDALHTVCLELAKKIVADGEGATKFIEVIVSGAANAKQAKEACFKIANSNLVKTAAYGSNPNWGRVAAAVGALGYKITDRSLKISFSPFKKKEIRIHTDLNLGKHKATVYTSDLSNKYVKINAEYN